MPKVNVGENEPLEKALRRFKKKIEIQGILKTLKAIGNSPSTKYIFPLEFTSLLETFIKSRES